MFLQILIYTALADTVHMYTKLSVLVCPSCCVTVFFVQWHLSQPQRTYWATDNDNPRTPLTDTTVKTRTQLTHDGLQRVLKTACHTRSVHELFSRLRVAFTYRAMAGVNRAIRLSRPQKTSDVTCSAGMQRATKLSPRVSERTAGKIRAGVAREKSLSSILLPARSAHARCKHRARFKKGALPGALSVYPILDRLKTL